MENIHGHDGHTKANTVILGKVKSVFLSIDAG